MQKNPEDEKPRKKWWLLLLLLLLLPTAGTVITVNSAGDGGVTPGSDVLGLNVPPTTEPAGSSATTKAAPASGTVKGSGKSSGSSGDVVVAAGKPDDSNPNGPQPPSITKAPDDPTFDSSAEFKFSGKQSGLGFRCKLDGGAFSSCNSGTANFNKLSAGEHTFQVLAVDSLGRVSAPTTYTWTILLRSGFEITGSLALPLFPGNTQSLNLSLGNPYNFPLKVLSVEVTVEPATTKIGVANPGCIGDQHLSVLHGLTAEVTVPAHSTKSLQQMLPAQPDAWPLIKMLNLPTNQDACKNTTFKLSYEGTATKS